MALLTRLDGKKKIKLKDFDTDDNGGLKREEGEAMTLKLEAELTALQELLSAAQQTPVLIVLQGMDTSGKDGTVRHVMGAWNPQGCDVASFKIPTPVEAAHDFLWRVHAQAPMKGSISIFNRSHYEDVLVVRVHKLVEEAVWQKRFDRINEFEQLLADAGVVIMKFFLHISKEEQEERLLDREKDSVKSWKLSPADWREREYWDDYQAAYEDVLNKCSTPYAPWYVVPANRKWYRDAAISQTIVETLSPLKKDWLKRLEEVGATAKQALAEMRANMPTTSAPSKKK